MSSTEWIVLAAVVVAVVVLVGRLWSRSRQQQQLRERFGPEYDRAVAETGSESKAQRELQQRQERHDALAIRPLPPEQRRRYAAAWDAVQARFVDDPVAALGGARELVQRVMTDRGYPTGDFEQQTDDLSVEHADVLDHYRAARAVEVGPSTSTERLREAMVHYRALFGALLDDQPAASGRNDGRAR